LTKKHGKNPAPNRSAPRFRKGSKKDAPPVIAIIDHEGRKHIQFWHPSLLLRMRFQIGTSRLRSQTATSEASHGGRRYLPYAFSEQGVATLSSVLHSKRAVQVNIAIMRTLVQLREILATHKDLAQKLEALEKTYDRQFKIVFDAIRELMAPEAPPKQRQIGFQTD
jgi:hypothetical protein